MGLIPHIACIQIGADAAVGLSSDVWRGGSEGAWTVLRAEFPAVRLETRVDRLREEENPCVQLHLHRWFDPDIEVYAHDRSVREPSRPFCLQVVPSRAGHVARGALEIATRYQGLLQVRNDSSSSPAFDRVLKIHREIHDLAKPLVEADYYHGLDTWQWVLRLEPRAGLEVQIAALFHDVERLSTEADRRVEHHAPDYVQFKQSHAHAGARFVQSLLRREVSPAVLARIVALIEHHEQASDAGDGALLEDADALSFFALNSTGFLDYYGMMHTRKKVEYTMRRLRPLRRWRLRWMRMDPVVMSMVHETLARDSER